MQFDSKATNFVAQHKTMTAEQIKHFIQGGKWVSISPELRPSISKNAAGDILPFYLTRSFTYSVGDVFECTVINYADPSAKIPLVEITIKGHLVWQGEHPLTAGAYNLDYVADIAYEVTPLNQAFADAINKIPNNTLSQWEPNKTQDVKGKAFPAFGLTEGQIYIDYDLIYIYNDFLFNGSKNVDGRAFDKPENRPTNLQVPLVRKF
nr:hypothetical protein [Mucilaginibacter lappiensis]